MKYVVVCVFFVIGFTVGLKYVAPWVTLVVTSFLSTK